MWPIMFFHPEHVRCKRISNVESAVNFIFLTALYFSDIFLQGLVEHSVTYIVMFHKSGSAVEC